MQIGVPLEAHAGETQASATPETTKKLVDQGHRVIVQGGAGVNASQSNSVYKAAGAMVDSAAEAFDVNLVLKVVVPSATELTQMKSGAVLVGMLDPFDNENIAHMAEHDITAFVLETAPRTSRAQSLDVLSSQANIAGYKAVMLTANHYPRFMPMLMTAVDTVKAAHVLVLGAGVAGLQAIAMTRRPGAIIEASDVRPAVKEQIESLSAKFIDVPYETDEERECAKGAGGYARPMPVSWIGRQAKAMHERTKQPDIVITAALIPDRKVPTLLHEAIVAEMKPGSMVIDLAVAQGDNYPLTEVDQVVVRHSVTIISHSNLAALVPAGASVLYTRNILDFLKLTLNAEGFSMNLEDNIVAACPMCRDGQAVRKSG